MKKIILISIIIISVSSQIFSQDLAHRMNKRATKIELYDIAGQKYTGFLWYANVFKVIMFDSEKDSLISVKPEDIYQIKLNKKWGFGRVFGNVSIVAATFILTGIVPFANVAVSNINVFFGATTALGVLSGLPIASYMQNKDKIDIKYTIGGSEEKFNKFLPILKHYSRMKSYSRIGRFYDYKNIVKIKPLKNIDITGKITKPTANQNPFKLNTYHISANFGFRFNNFNKQFEAKLQSSDFASSSYFFNPEKDNKQTFYHFNFEYNIRPQFRFYANYSTATQTNIIIQSEALDIITYRNKLNAVETGFSFIFAPVNYSMIRPIEISLSAGLAYNSLNSEYTFERAQLTNEKKYHKNYSYNTDIFGLNIAGNLHYYLTQHVSVKFNFQANIMMPTIIPRVTEVSATGKTITTNDIQLNIFSIRQIIGLSYHF